MGAETFQIGALAGRPARVEGGRGRPGGEAAASAEDFPLLARWLALSPRVFSQEHGRLVTLGRAQADRPGVERALQAAAETLSDLARKKR